MTQRRDEEGADLLRADYVAHLLGLMMPATREQFRELELRALCRALQVCNLVKLPDVTGDPLGERAGGDARCPICSQTSLSHPLDWRQIGYGDVPYNHILCDGRRVKL